MVLAFQQCESHPGRLLTDHLLDVCRRLPEDVETHDTLKLAGSFHDLGKATAFFQSHLYGGRPPQDLKRHAELGSLWLFEVLRQRTDYKGHSSVDMAMGYLMVLRHHGHLGDILDELIPDPSSADRVHRQLAEMDIGGIQQWIAETTALRAFPPAVDARAFTELRVKLKPALAAVRSEMEAMGRLQSALRSFGLLIEADRDSAAGFAPGHFDASSPLSPEHLARLSQRGDFGPSAG